MVLYIGGTGIAGTVTFCLREPEPECITIPVPNPVFGTGFSASDIDRARFGIKKC
jgi:hypothetical protein